MRHHAASSSSTSAWCPRMSCDVWPDDGRGPAMSGAIGTRTVARCVTVVRPASVSRSMFRPIDTRRLEAGDSLDGRGILYNLRPRAWRRGWLGFGPRRFSCRAGRAGRAPVDPFPNTHHTYKRATVDTRVALGRALLIAAAPADHRIAFLHLTHLAHWKQVMRYFVSERLAGSGGPEVAPPEVPW